MSVSPRRAPLIILLRKVHSRVGGANMRALLLLLLLCVAVAHVSGYYILLANMAGNYNVSTSLPAWQRLDATGMPSFIVAEDITLPLQLTRCDELVVDVTVLMAKGTNPTVPESITFWIFPSAGINVGTPFDTSAALTSQTFLAPSEGSWEIDQAVRHWTTGSQTFYVSTVRFRLNQNVMLRGNTTYWIAMVIAQNRAISPVDSTFNTPRWLVTGTPNSAIGSAAQFRGVDRNGTMFRTVPALAYWSNASAVEATVMPFLANTATSSATHQMAFTAYVGQCYAPPNVFIPSSRNMSSLPGPTEYATQAPPVTINWPPSVTAAAPSPVHVPTKLPVPPPPPRVIFPPRAVPPTPKAVPAPPPHMVSPPPPPVVIFVPDEPTTPIAAPIIVHEVSPPPPPPGPDHNSITSGAAPQSLLTNPFSSGWFIALLVVVAFLLIVVVAIIFIIVSRRLRTRVVRKSKGPYGEVDQEHDETKEIELTDDEKGVELSEEDDSSDSREFQSQRVYNGTLNPQALEQMRDETSMISVPMDDTK